MSFYKTYKIKQEGTTLLKGIPQGLCLSPFLFNVFINDIFYFIEMWCPGLDPLGSNSSCTCVLYRFRGIFDIKEKEIMYNTFILSNFKYCPIIWHFCSKTTSKKVENIQERAVRFMFNEKSVYMNPF